MKEMLKGRQALITGGAGEMASTIAATLAAEGASIVLLDINEKALETVKVDLQARFDVAVHTYVHDLCDFDGLAGMIDTEAERAKLEQDLAYYEGFLKSVMAKLSNERFVQNAPEKVVANERAKKADAEAKIAAIKAQLEALK